jgi:hypothetical protein
MTRSAVCRVPTLVNSAVLQAFIPEKTMREIANSKNYFLYSKIGIITF